MPSLHTQAAPAEPAMSPRQLRRHRIAIVAGVAALVALGVFWVLVLTGQLTPSNPDRLADRAWARRAEATCKPVATAIAKLPNAGEARDVAQRIDGLAKATALLRPMVAKLASSLPASTGDQKAVRGWLADWQIYLADREAYIDALRREGGRAKPLFRSIHGTTADQTITSFADLNSMSSCATPLDL